MVAVADGKDISQYIQDEGEEVTFRKVLGKNSATALSGREIEDVLAIKVDLTYYCEYLTQDEVSELSNIFTKKLIDFTFFDPRTKAPNTLRFRPSMSTFNKVLENDGVTYWGEVELYLEEE